MMSEKLKSYSTESAGEGEIMPMINLAEGMTRVWTKRCVGFVVLCGWLLMLSFFVTVNFPSAEPWLNVLIFTGVELSYLRPGLELEKLHYNGGLGRAFWILFILNAITLAFAWAWLLYWVVEGKPFNADRVDYPVVTASMMINLIMAILVARARGRNWNDLTGKMDITGIILQWLTEPAMMIVLCLGKFNIWPGYFNTIMDVTFIGLAIGLVLQIVGHTIHQCKHPHASWLFATAAQESDLSPELEPLEKGESKAMYKSCERVEENCKEASPRSRSPGSPRSPPAKSSPGLTGSPGDRAEPAPDAAGD